MRTPSFYCFYCSIPSGLLLLSIIMYFSGDVMISYMDARLALDNIHFM